MKKCEAKRNPAHNGEAGDWSCDREFCIRTGECEWRERTPIGLSTPRLKRNGKT